MNRYSKGARSERELLAMLKSRGYSVVRSAGSGISKECPDIVALKDGKILSFECKAWNKGSLYIEKDQYEALRRWEENTKSFTFVAWRINGKGWFFIRLEELNGGKEYKISKSRVFEINRRIEKVI
ncbi:MAG: Holliday junction resolvase Hjc [Candidatus Micrarchaeaceae archaeon]